MKIRYTDYTHVVKVDCELQDAIVSELDGDDYGLGSIETLERTVENQSRLLGKLTEVLVDQEVITFEEMNEMVFGGQRVEKKLSKENLFNK